MNYTSCKIKFPCSSSLSLSRSLCLSLSLFLPPPTPPHPLSPPSLALSPALSAPPSPPSPSLSFYPSASLCPAPFTHQLFAMIRTACKRDRTINAPCPSVLDRCDCLLQVPQVRSGRQPGAHQVLGVWRHAVFPELLLPDRHRRHHRWCRHAAHCCLRGWQQHLPQVSGVTLCVPLVWLS